MEGIQFVMICFWCNNFGNCRVQIVGTITTTAAGTQLRILGITSSRTDKHVLSNARNHPQADTQGRGYAYSSSEGSQRKKNLPCKWSQGALASGVYLALHFYSYLMELTTNYQVSLLHGATPLCFSSVQQSVLGIDELYMRTRIFGFYTGKYWTRIFVFSTLGLRSTGFDFLTLSWSTFVASSTLK